jgi:hypothetical protein
MTGSEAGGNLGALARLGGLPDPPGAGGEGRSEGLAAWGVQVRPGGSRGAGEVRSDSQDYIRLLNIGTGKYIAILLVVAFAIYHRWAPGRPGGDAPCSLLHATYGVTPCKGLLKDGMYKVEPSCLLPSTTRLRGASGSPGAA